MRRGSLRGLVAATLIAGACCRPSAATGPSATVTGEGAPPPDARDLVDLTIGASGACGVFADRTAACWGLWDGGTFSVTTPAVTLAEVVELRAGQALADPQHFVHHFCARDAAGAVQCWGNNREGQTGRGDHVDAATPDRVAIPAPVAGLALGMRHTCALTASGEVWCWGDNRAGQVAGPDAAVPAPRRVEGVAGAVQLFAESDTTCALIAPGSVRCWGFPYGAAPRELPAAAGTVRLGTGSSPSCSIMSEGRVACWAALGELVGPAHAGDGVVTIAGLPAASMVSSGTTHACAVSQGGEVWCWGRGGEGELGTGRVETDVVPPTRVVLPAAATTVIAAHHNTCARLVDRRWLCWGRNVGGPFGPSRPVLAPVELDLARVRFTAR